MKIEHQIITDQDGQPTAAIIPWDQFQVIKAEMEAPLDPKTKAMLDRRSQELKDGTVEGITTEEMFERVRERIEERRNVSKSA